jgi:hypothetical protein
MTFQKHMTFVYFRSWRRAIHLIRLKQPVVVLTVKTLSYFSSTWFPQWIILKELINSLKNTENDYFYNNVELLETAYLNDLWLMEWLWAA